MKTLYAALSLEALAIILCLMYRDFMVGLACLGCLILVSACLIVWLSRTTK